MEAVLAELIMIAANCIQFYLWITLYHHVLERRFSPVRNMAGEFCCLCVYIFCLVFFKNHVFIRVLSLLIIIFSFPLLFFKSSRREAVTCSACIVLTSALSKIIMFPCLAGSIMPDNLLRLHPCRLIGYSLLYLCGEIILLLLLPIFSRNFKKRFPGHFWFYFMCFPICQYFLLYSYFMIMHVYTLPVCVFYPCAGVIVCIVSDIGLYNIILHITKTEKLNAEIRLLNQQLFYQTNHFKSFTTHYEEIRKMRHDIANHLLAVRSLLEEGNIDEALLYTKEIEDSTRDFHSVGICQHPVVDAYLSNRRQMLSENGIELKCDVSIPPDISITSLDLISLFGNLLDNATEACSSLKGCCIQINAHCSHGYLIIKTINPMPAEPPARKKERIPGLERGLGLHILDDIAAKHDAELITEVKDCCFRVTVLLKEGSSNAAD